MCIQWVKCLRFLVSLEMTSWEDFLRSRQSRSDHMPIARKITPEEQLKTLAFYNDLKVFYKAARGLAGEVDGLLLQVPNLYASREGKVMRKSAYSVSDEIMDAYSFRKNRVIAPHYVSRAYDSSVKTVEFLLKEKSLDRLRQREIFKTLIKKYSGFQKRLFDFVGIENRE